MRIYVPQKRYGKSIIIRNVDIQLNRGMSTLIIGTSGAGKSTLIGCIIREGFRYVTFEDDEFHGRMPKIAYIQQHPALNKDLTVRETIYYARRFEYLFEPKDQVNRKVDKYIDMLGLRARQDNKVRKLSGGQQQRVAIAKELIRDCEILIADEIDTGLDCGVARSLAETLADITREQKIITLVISHNVINIPLYDKIVVLAKDKDNIGGVAYDCPPDRILNFFNVRDYFSILTQVNLKEEGGNGLGDYFINLTRNDPHQDQAFRGNTERGRKL